MSASSEPMLHKLEWHRFGQSGMYRDLPFAVLFVLQLLTVATIAAVNGVESSHQKSAGASQSPASSSQHMVVMLSVASIVGGLWAAFWLLLLRAGARSLIWIGAGGGTLLATANGVWLLFQGDAAGLLLGCLSLFAAASCVFFLLFNRHRVEFSINLLSTVADLVRAYPETIYLAAVGTALQLVWLMIWSSAVAYTATRQGEMPIGLFLLLALSLFWTTQCIKAVLHTSVAGTIGSWYFLSPNVPRNSTGKALRRALTTSFGSLCLGSLVAASLQMMRGVARSASRKSAGTLRSCCLCLLGFVDVLVRFFNEFAYTQVALYGKSFTRASRDTWTLLVHHSAVDALVQRDLIASALGFGALLGGLGVALFVAVWAHSSFGGDSSLWWESQLCAFAIGYTSTSLVSSVVESGVCALYVCYAEDPEPLAAVKPELYHLFLSTPHPYEPQSLSTHTDTPLEPMMPYTYSASS